MPVRWCVHTMSPTSVTYGAVTGGERIAILLADMNGPHDLLLSHSLVVIPVNRSLGKALFFVISQD